MVVDDEPDITLTYKIGLENYGFIVDIYNEPDLALSNFKAEMSAFWQLVKRQHIMRCSEEMKYRHRHH